MMTNVNNRRLYSISRLKFYSLAQTRRDGKLSSESDSQNDLLIERRTRKIVIANFIALLFYSPYIISQIPATSELYIPGVATVTFILRILLSSSLTSATYSSSMDKCHFPKNTKLVFTFMCNIKAGIQMTAATNLINIFQ